jgi:hypothetical protein
MGRASKLGRRNNLEGQGIPWPVTAEKDRTPVLIAVGTAHWIGREEVARLVAAGAWLGGILGKIDEIKAGRP